MTTRFVLLRHGTCGPTASVLLGRALDASLDGRGIREVRAAAAALRALRPRRVDASPRLRTRETAALVAEAVGCEWQVEPALDEVDYGRWGGCTFAALEADPDWREWNAHRATRLTPAGDGTVAVRRRLYAHLAATAAREPGATIVCVTHAELIRAAVLDLAGMDDDDFLHVEIATASATTVTWTDGALRLESVNETLAA